MAEEREETTEMASEEEIQEVLDEATPPPQRQGEAFIDEEEVTPVPQVGLNVGGLRDRAAAGFFDLLIVGYLYWSCLLVYNMIVWHQLLRPLPTRGMHAIIFHGIFLLLSFLYFFISEGVFFTTLGKFFCRLSVRNKEGGPASLLSIALRNILRPLDYLLLVLPTWIFLEKSARRQRLGDFLSGTVVMKHYGRSPTRLIVSGKTASATVRLTAGLVDLILGAAWIGGLALFIDYQRPIFSFLLLLLLPIFYLLWHIGWESLFQTTMGLTIFGCRLAQEDGSPLGFAPALLRALLRLFDTNPVGWITLFLSNKNQRPADLAAGTVVVYAKRTWKVLIGVGVSLAAIVVVWFAGMVNPHNYLTPFFKTDFLSKIFTINIGGGPNIPASQGLFIKQFSYLMPDKVTPRPSAEFKPGETVNISFEVTGFSVRDGEGWIQENMVVRYPDGEIHIKKENIAEAHQLLKNPETPLQFNNPLSLPTDAQPGHYTLVIVLHDRLSDRHLTEQRTFLVTAP